MFGPSHYSIHLITCFVIKPALNRSNGLNRRTGQTVQFFANRPHLYLTNICLPFKRPNICLPFIRPMIHQVHSTPNALKTKTNYKLNMSSCLKKKKTLNMKIRKIITLILTSASN